MTLCSAFVPKAATDPGGREYCRRCGLHADIHPGPGAPPFGTGPWRVTDVYSVGPLGDQWAALRDSTGTIVARMPWAQAIEVNRLLSTEAARTNAPT